MRKIPAALAVLTLAVVGLTGCSMAGASAASGCTRPAVPDQKVMDQIDVSGSFGKTPTVEASTPFHTEHVSFEDAVVGEGTPITSEDQLVVVDIALVSGKTGEILAATPFNGSLTDVRQVSTVTDILPGIGDALHCATEGTRVVVALPPGAVAEQTASGLGLGKDDSSIAVIDVDKVYLPAANGSNVYNSDSGLPTVVRAPNGRPGIIIPDNAPPTKLVTQTIKKGAGEVVTGDVPVRVHYTAVKWDDKTVAETTWDGAPKSVTLDSVGPGFGKAIKGATVGSQLMVVVPPSEQGASASSGGSTLVYVIDILGLDAPAAQQ